MKIISILQDSAMGACEELFGSKPKNVQLQLTSKDFEGQWTLVVFPLLQLSKKSPEQTGEAIGNYLVEHCAEVVQFNVVKGFLNLVIADSYWNRVVESVAARKNYGFSEPESKPLVLVEFSSPNTNKPLHLGHLRNIFLGDSVSSVLKAAGHRVQRVQIINDRGIHICKSMVAWKKFGQGETPESAGVKGDKLVGKYYVAFDKQYKKEIAEAITKGKSQEEAEKEAPILREAQEMLRLWEQKDPEIYTLWQKMNGWVYEGFDVTYNKMGVQFDHLYYESETYLYGKEEVERGVSDGIFTRRSDGSVWVDLAAEGLDQKLLLRSDSTAVYMTQDIGTAIQRHRDYPGLSKMVYTVGNEQEYHFKVLFAVLQKLGYPWASDCHHLSYGMVELPEGKMKSREGTVVDADDLMDEMTNTARVISEELGKLEDLTESEQDQLYHQIALSALKYFLLKVDARKNMLFNPKESIDFNGHTGPFIQYTHARIRSLLRKADGSPKVENEPVILSDIERSIALMMDRYSAIIQESAEKLSPAELAAYLYELAKDFNTFYQNVVVLKEEDESLRNFRLLLTESAGKILKSGMKLLGIEVPERM